uniref:Putative Mov34/MPN/PAD-1 metallopeptidase n=1 Tax=Trypanosoma congolense (strain IL3000) TaxID=1068625 RepID=G0UTB9_TRYCI|nr:putative Mov34/MPN/PAD-1 metallopeptidase [Trypanosoma congolense IL3000]
MTCTSKHVYLSVQTCYVSLSLYSFFLFLLFPFVLFKGLPHCVPLPLALRRIRCACVHISFLRSSTRVVTPPYLGTSFGDTHARTGEDSLRSLLILSLLLVPIGAVPLMDAKRAPLRKVRVADTVIQSCYVHAFSTEQEEVMGLLLGEVIVSTDCEKSAGEPNASSSVSIGPFKEANVWDSWVVQRSVRCSDRVEMAPELLSGASEEAERCTKQVGTHTRVIGWYHSHPRITPYPSHVDLRSQLSYQMMESGWVGLIFSVFYCNGSKQNATCIHCFQTGPGGTHEMVDLEIVPISKMPLKSLPPSDSTCRLLRTFRTEVEAAVEFVRKRCGGAQDAMDAARNLRDVQFYILEKLIAQPAILHMQCSVAELRKKVQELESRLQKKRPGNDVLFDVFN